MSGLALFTLLLPIAAAAPAVLAAGAVASPAAVAGLAIGLGLGVSSIAPLLALAGGSHAVLLAFDASLAAAGLFAAIRRARFPTPRQRWRPMHGLGVALLGLASAAAVAGFLANAAVRPHGEWDAWAIWNLRARFLARADGAWRAAFDGALAWSHPDYPLMLPDCVARVWMHLGATPTSVPSAVALLFAAATAAVLFGLSSDLRTRGAALLATLALVGTPAFPQQAAWQYADIPLGFFILSALALLAAADRRPEQPGPAYLAGAMAGLAAWTKNEGLLFVAVVVAVRAGATRLGTRSDRATLARFALGALPALAAVIAFKLLVAPSGDRFNEPMRETLGRLTDLGRYAQTVRAIATEAARLTAWVGAALLAYALLLGRAAAARRAGGRAVAVVLLMLMGYILVYVITADDLAWQLERSASRVVMQLWPSFLFAFFATFAAPDESPACPATAPSPKDSRRTARRRPGAPSSPRSA